MTKYLEILQEQLDYHNFETKVQHLHDAASNAFNGNLEKIYETLDMLLTESMRHAESKCSITYSKKKNWSPVLKAAVKEVRYWQLRLKQTKGFIVRDSTLRQAAKDTNLGKEETATAMSLLKIVDRVRSARAHLKELQKQHVELRMNHLKSLAEARLLHRNPNHTLMLPDKQEKARKKEVSRIQCTETIRMTHRKVRACLKHMEDNSPLTSIDVPNTTIPLGHTSEVAKSWKGSWKTIQDPEEIASHVCQANAAQYHQAHDTPFGSDPLLSYFGPNANGRGADDLVTGKDIPEHIQVSLLPETKALLSIVQRITPSPNGALEKNVTKERFQALYNALYERTSSSPSGRHIGHYKAVAQSTKLSDIFSKMMDIPYSAGFSPKRWQNVIDVMLPKSPGDSCLYRLRIVALQESDYNQSNQLLIGQPVMHHLEDTIDKQLTFEIARYTKTSVAYIENDATGCYERITNPLVLLYLRRKGVPLPIINSLTETWKNTTHRIKTAYGISESIYSNTLEYFLFGPGQGSTIGPILWLICFTLIYTSLSKESPSIVFTSIDKTVQVKSKGALS